MGQMIGAIENQQSTPDDSAEWRTNISKHCWTHGACGHFSKDYPRKAPDHKKDATFDNKKGGSKARCE